MQKEKLKKKIERLIKYPFLNSFKNNNGLMKIINAYPECLLWKYTINEHEMEMKNVSIFQFAAFYSSESLRILYENNYFIMKEKAYLKDIEDNYGLFEEDEDFNIVENEDKVSEPGQLFVNEKQHALEYAIKGNNEKSVAFLIANGADLNKPLFDSGSASLSALSIALNADNYKLAQKLINIYHASPENIGDQMHQAVMKLDIKKIKFIIDNGGKTNINKLDIKGRPPIALLVLAKNIYEQHVDKKVKDIIDLLLLNGAQFEIDWKKNKNDSQKKKSENESEKFNVLNYLIARGLIKKDLILYLQEKGAHIDLNNQNSLTGYNNLLNGLSHLNCWKNLSELGINIAEHPKLLLMYQLYNQGRDVKQYKVINMMIKNGINVEETLEEQKTRFNGKRYTYCALSLAVKEKNEDTVRLLLENKASPEYEHVNLLNLIVEEWKSYNAEMQKDFEEKHRKKYIKLLEVEKVRVNRCCKIFDILMEYGANINNAASSNVKLSDADTAYTVYPLLWALPEEFKSRVNPDKVNFKIVLKKAFSLYEENFSYAQSIEQLKNKIEQEIKKYVFSENGDTTAVIEAYSESLSQLKNNDTILLLQIHFGEMIAEMQKLKIQHLLNDTPTENAASGRTKRL